MNIPNILTYFRLFLIPIFILTFFSNVNNSLLYSMLIFTLAGITDILDGYIARKFNWITDLGIVLDPLADKLMLITVLSCLVIKSFIPLWVLLIVALKEFFMIFSGIALYRKQIVIPSNKFGKAASFLFYIAILFLIINYNFAKVLLYAAVASAILALSNYTLSYLKNKK